MEWLAGMHVTADRLNDFTPVSLASTVTPATGFSLSSFTARKAGGVVEFTVVLTRTGADLTAANSAGNIADVTCCTLPADVLPGALYITQFDKGGVASGSVRIFTSGQCDLTSMDPTSQIQSGNTINFSGTFATG